MNTSYLSFTDSNAYKISTSLSDYIWDIVAKWEWFSKSTTGMQYVKSVDSISGNVAEGFGRFHKKDKEKFYYNARGSVYESIHWTEKAKKRKLITEEEYMHIINELARLPREINWLIKVTEEKLSV